MFGLYDVESGNSLGTYTSISECFGIVKAFVMENGIEYIKCLEIYPVHPVTEVVITGNVVNG